jgi:hypothetical protein
LSVKSDGEGGVDSAWKQVHIWVLRVGVSCFEDILDLAQLHFELLESELCCLDLQVSVRVNEGRVQGSQGRHSSGSKILYDEDVIEELVVCGHALRNVPGRNVLAVRGEFESVEGLLELGKFREDGSEAGHSQRHVAIRLGLGEVEGGVVAGLVPDDSGKDVDHLGSGLGLLGEAVDVSVLLVRALLEEQGKFLVSLDLVVGIVESFDDLCHVLPDCVLKHLSVIQVPVKKGMLEVGVEAS